MNFLAHLFLSCDQEELLVGNFIADFIKNKDVPTFSKGIQEGISLHRKIDSFTDNHPLVRKGVSRLHANHHKYASVIIDVFYDFLLARNWNRYYPKSLPLFTQDIYQILLKHLKKMPSTLQQHAKRMIEDNWLMVYTSYSGLEETFRRMKYRVSKPEYLNYAVKSLQNNLTQLDEEFNLFFPEVIGYVEEQCNC